MTNNKKVWLHSSSDHELSLKHISYATLDAFTSYYIYKCIAIMSKCLLSKPRQEEPA